MPIATSDISIATPVKYMNRLAKHFEHRRGVERKEHSATITFPDGLCSLQATPSQLFIRIESTAAESLVRYREVVERHLKQVASQETFDVVWIQE